VFARDIEADPALTIINEGQLIATLTQDVELSIEFWVETGRGYRQSDENMLETQDLGVIAVDSVFSPVTRVRYKTEETRVGQRTNYDRLILEIWTKGTIRPEDSLVEAAKILRKHLNPFVQYFELGSDSVSSEPSTYGELSIDGPVDKALQERMSMPISQLDLSVRASNCLESAKVTTVGELARMSESDLLKVRSFGRTSLREVKRKLADLGLSLGMGYAGGSDSSPGDDNGGMPPGADDDGGGDDDPEGNGDSGGGDPVTAGLGSLG
jgi:DNA-directed RNA polymerase subunit alpha